MKFDLKKLHCKELRLRFYFDIEDFPKEAVPEDHKCFKEHPIGTSIHFKNTKNEHSHIFILLDEDESWFEIVFHTGELESGCDAKNYRLKTYLSTWFKRFRKTLSNYELKAKIETVFEFDSKITLMNNNFPTSFTLNEVKDLHITGYRLNSLNSSVINNAFVTHDISSIFINLVGECDFSLATDEIQDFLRLHEQVARSLIKFS